MFEVFKINSDHPFHKGLEEFKLSDFKDNKYLDPSYFTRTLASVRGESVLDLSLRSSWTNRHKFRIETPDEVQDFFKQHNIMTGDAFDIYTLLMYQEGDFFKNHRDRQVSPHHKYTCLIFFFDEDNQYEGGNLILHKAENLFKIDFKPSNYSGFLMVIFSLDLYHEVLPIIRGKRYVFKKTLLVNPEVTSSLQEDKVEEPDGLNLNEEGGRVEHQDIRLEEKDSDDSLRHEETENSYSENISNTDAIYEVGLEDIGPEESSEEEFGLDVGGQGIFSSNDDDDILLPGDSQVDGLENVEPDSDFSYVREELMDVCHEDIDDY